MESKQKDHRAVIARYLKCVVRQLVMGAVVVVVVFAILGCSPMVSQGMKADTMRAAMDECKQHNLSVLLYQRPDSSVFAIRCIPKTEEIEKTVRVRPRMPMNMMRPFIHRETLVIEDE